MVSRQTQYGQEGESIAARHLKKCGYKILERNYRNNIGEIDIIAMDCDTIVFVEVKTRRNHHFGGPKWAVTHRKQQKISMVALFYLKQLRMCDRKARFDVVTVTETDNKPTVEIVKNAFEVAYK
jgi:putative endonuclease